MAEVKYPEIEVQLSGEDGNAFMVVSRVARALKRAKVSAEEIDAFRDEALSGDYNNVLTTASRYVTVL